MPLKMALQQLQPCVILRQQLPYTIMIYGLTPYIHKYFNTTVSSNYELKNAKTAKIANPRNINPVKIKVHTYIVM